MSDDEKIKELEERFTRLQARMREQYDELFALKQELQKLTANKEKLFSRTNDTISPNSSFSFENFIGLRLLHLVGIVVLVIGLAIGVKYAIDRELITETSRIALAYLAAGILFFFSLKLREKYSAFSAILFSGSMAAFYFTTYAAHVYYSIFPFYLAFIIMVLLTIYTAVMALSYNRQEIAILGMIGAYGIPFLISANDDRADLFFSYIFLINCGIVFLSLKKKWNNIGYLAMILTWVLLLGWATVRYNEYLLSIGLTALVAFYGLFMFIVVNRIRDETQNPWEKVQLILYNHTAVYLVLLLLFKQGDIYNNSSSVTGYYFLFNALLFSMAYYYFKTMNVPVKVLLFQSVVLLVLFVVFLWDGVYVPFAWLAIAVGLFVWGVTKKHSWPRVLSIGLFGLTILKLIFSDSLQFSTVQKIIAYLVTGVILLIVSFSYQKFKTQIFEEKSEQEPM